MSLAVAASTFALLVLLLRERQQNNIVAVSAEAPTPPAGTVSVIIPAFNEENYIEQTLLDMQQQNIVQLYPDLFEFIVVDNESTDNTASIASAYAKVITAPRGKLNAMMAGAEEASGDILYFCDADVRADPNFLNTVLRHFDKQEVVATCGSPYHYALLLRLLDTTWSAVNSSGLKVNGASFAVRRNVFFEVGGFDTAIDQFDRKAMQQEEELSMATKLKGAGLFIVDVDATFYAPPRVHSQVFDSYFVERATGQRF